MSSHDAPFWREAIDDEIHSILSNNTWILSDLPPGCKPIGCRWIFRKKMKSDGTLDKYKARLVDKGFTQLKDIDYFDTFAPVAWMTSIHLLIALATIHGLVIHQMDVKTAFLNGNLDEEVFMKQPEGFVIPGQERKVFEDFLLHDLYVLVISTEQHHNSERLKEGITQVLTIINKQHQPWVDGQDLLDDALQNKRFLPTGCKSIDTFLLGGLREGYLTELVGTSSSGKTQICLQAASAVAKSWGKIVFLDSGNSFSPKRVSQIITQTSDLSAYEVDKGLQQVMNNIVCLSVFDIFTLFEVLHQLKNNLRSQIDQHIRMVIIDSISSLITPILGGGGAHGHALMVSVGFLLKRLAHEHDISILVTNHMVVGEGGTSKPALGESWRSIPHVRLLLSRGHIRNISSMSVLRHPHM
ncbi:DNA repair protein RAD51 homolog 4 isoform X2 [Capsicum annuum]|nr:DNA repair protein RAD51 homolog 4 isoform X2 [Capsicum annuum]